MGAQIVQRGVQLVHALHVGEPRVQLRKDEQRAAHLLQMQACGRWGVEHPSRFHNSAARRQSSDQWQGDLQR
jgi:hypothetical protein